MDVRAKKRGLYLYPYSPRRFEFGHHATADPSSRRASQGFKHNVPVRQRSKFVQRLLGDALPPEDGSDDDPLYQAALAVEKEHELTTEMAEWEVATIADGLSDGGPSKKHR